MALSRYAFAAALFLTLAASDRRLVSDVHPHDTEASADDSHEFSRSNDELRAFATGTPLAHSLAEKNG